MTDPLTKNVDQVQEEDRNPFDRLEYLKYYRGATYAAGALGLALFITSLAAFRDSDLKFNIYLLVSSIFTLGFAAWSSVWAYRANKDLANANDLFRGEVDQKQTLGLFILSILQALTHLILLVNALVLKNYPHDFVLAATGSSDYWQHRFGDYKAADITGYFDQAFFYWAIILAILAIYYLFAARALFKFVTNGTHAMSYSIFLGAFFFLGLNLFTFSQADYAIGYEVYPQLKTLVPTWVTHGLYGLGIGGAVLAVFTFLIDHRKYRVGFLALSFVLLIYITANATLTGYAYRRADAVYQFYGGNAGKDGLKVCQNRMHLIHEDELTQAGCPVKYLPNTCDPQFSNDRWEDTTTPQAQRVKYCHNTACCGVMGQVYSTPYLTLANLGLSSLLAAFLISVGSYYFWFKNWTIQREHDGDKDWIWGFLLIALLAVFFGVHFGVDRSYITEYKENGKHLEWAFWGTPQTAPGTPAQWGPWGTAPGGPRTNFLYQWNNWGSAPHGSSANGLFEWTSFATAHPLTWEGVSSIFNSASVPSNKLIGKPAYPGSYYEAHLAALPPGPSYLWTLESYKEQWTAPKGAKRPSYEEWTAPKGAGRPKYEDWTAPKGAGRPKYEDWTAPKGAGRPKSEEWTAPKGAGRPKSEEWTAPKGAGRPRAYEAFASHIAFANAVSNPHQSKAEYWGLADISPAPTGWSLSNFDLGDFNTEDITSEDIASIASWFTDNVASLKDQVYEDWTAPKGAGRPKFEWRAGDATNPAGWYPVQNGESYWTNAAGNPNPTYNNWWGPNAPDVSASSFEYWSVTKAAALESWTAPKGAGRPRSFETWAEARTNYEGTVELNWDFDEENPLSNADWWLNQENVPFPGEDFDYWDFLDGVSDWDEFLDNYGKDGFDNWNGTQISFPAGAFDNWKWLNFTYPSYEEWAAAAGVPESALESYTLAGQWLGAACGPASSLGQLEAWMNKDGISAFEGWSAPKGAGRPKNEDWTAPKGAGRPKSEEWTAPKGAGRPRNEAWNAPKAPGRPRFEDWTAPKGAGRPKSEEWTAPKGAGRPKSEEWTAPKGAGRPRFTEQWNVPATFEQFSAAEPTIAALQHLPNGFYKLADGSTAYYGPVGQLASPANWKGDVPNVAGTYGFEWWGTANTDPYWYTADIPTPAANGMFEWWAYTSQSPPPAYWWDELPELAENVPKNFEWWGTHYQAAPEGAIWEWTNWGNLQDLPEEFRNIPFQLPPGVPKNEVRQGLANTVNADVSKFLNAWSWWSADDLPDIVKDNLPSDINDLYDLVDGGSLNDLKSLADSVKAHFPKSVKTYTTALFGSFQDIFNDFDLSDLDEDDLDSLFGIINSLPEGARKYYEATAWGQVNFEELASKDFAPYVWYDWDPSGSVAWSKLPSELQAQFPQNIAKHYEAWDSIPWDQIPAEYRNNPDLRIMAVPPVYAPVPWERLSSNVKMNLPEGFRAYYEVTQGGTTAWRDVAPSLRSAISNSIQQHMDFSNYGPALPGPWAY